MKKQPIIQLSEKICAPLQAIGAPQRVAILLAIGKGEACVCHLEAALGWRQAYISQQLMALRQAGILADRREGRYVYYRITDLRYLDLLRSAGTLNGLSPEAISEVIRTESYPACGCPHCTPALIPAEGLEIR
jgi:ArsR family transcriptional regulator